MFDIIEGETVKVQEKGISMEQQTFDRLPPKDEDAEKSVLGAMMLDSEAVDAVSQILQASDFYLPAHQTIFQIIIDLFMSSKVPDPVVVSSELDRSGNLDRVGGAPYIHDLTAMVPTAANAEFYANIVREKAQLRALVTTGTKVVQLGYASDGSDVEALINAAQAEVYALSDERAKNDYRPVRDFWDETIDELQKMQVEGEGTSGVPTGFYELDKVSNGLHGGQLIIVAARPAMGKSTLALDFCRWASLHRGITSAIFSLEMTGDEILKRLISAESSVPMSKFNGSSKLEPEEWARVFSVGQKCHEAPLFIDDSPNMTIPEIRAKCRKMKQQYNLGLVVVDYLQLITTGKKFESRQTEVSEYSRALKLMAKELDIPVVAVAQLNRGPESRTDHRPMLSDLRESGSLEQDADMVMLINRPEVYDKSVRPGEADLIIAKHRNGPTMDLPLVFLGQYSRFANMAPKDAM